MSAKKLAPVQWAQREDRVFVTFVIPDAKDVNLKFQPDQVIFECKDATGTAYGTVLNVLHPIVPDKCTYKVHGSKVASCLFKEAAMGQHWERLTKEPTKATKHYISVDWSLWKDEDEEAPKGGMGGMGDFDMSQFMGGGGMGGMGGMGDMGGGGDSDDEEAPPQANLDDLAPETKPVA